jgi:hypothetical protein
MFVDNDGDMGTSVLRQKVFVVYLQKVSWLLAVGFGLVLSGVALNRCVCVKTILPLLFLNMKNILFCNDSLKTLFNLYFFKKYFLYFLIILIC